jgi:phosphocarrier protein
MIMDCQSSTESGDAEAVSQTVTILNKRGLHARASAKFVECAGQFDAQILVAREGMSVNGTSIMGLMMLAAHPGSQIEISVTGHEAKAALASIVALIEAKFDED